MIESKSERMRRLFAKGKTVSEVAMIVGVDYAFAYGVAKRAGLAEKAVRRRGPGALVRAAAPSVTPRPKAMLPAPTTADLARARKQYKQVEPRDLFYRAAADLLARAGGAAAVLNLGEALAVLLFSWNPGVLPVSPTWPGAHHRYRGVAGDI